MEARERIYLKSNNNTDVYQYADQPNLVFKKYKLDYETFNSQEELKERHDRLMQIKHRKNWPDFVLKPKQVFKLYKTTFTASFPYVEGISLEKYIKTHKIDLKFCGELIKKLESMILPLKDFVFPDIATTGNIIIRNDDINQLDLFIIDPDNIQFGNLKCDFLSIILGEYLFSDERALGLKKCFKRGGSNYANKQLDIRSMYALFYCLFNADDYFYPIFVNKDMMKYISNLQNMFKVPAASSLYLNSLRTLSDDEKNIPIADSILELVDDGYDFKAIGKDKNGYRYEIQRKRTPFPVSRV